MTIASAVSRVSYTGNGSVSTYSYTFRIFQDSDLLVTVVDTDSNETALTLTTDYTVTGAGDSGGGTIVLVSNSQAWLTAGKLTSGYGLVIRRVLDLTQETDIRNQGDFFPESHEDQFDKSIMIDQQQQDEIDRSIKLPESINPSSFDASLPSDITDSDSAGKAVVVNTTSDGFSLSETSFAGADALFLRDIVYIAFADSPYTLSSSHRGKLISVDTSGGAVTVNLPAISGLDLTESFSVVLRKQTSDTNAVTIAPNGSETIDKVASSITLVAQSHGAILTPDKELSPDDWQSMQFRRVSVAGSVVGTTDTQTLTNKSLQDSTTSFVDNSDATKVFKVECSGITTATTRTMTVPDADFTAVGLATAQTLTNKTLTSPTLTTPVIDVASLTEQGSTPSTPSAGTRKFYATSSGLFQKDSNGNVSQVGAGTGGSKNYLTTYKGNTGNGDFELGLTTGWSEMAVTLTSAIPTGTPTISAAAATSITLAATSSSPLGGVYSLAVAGASAWTAGDGFISSAFTIDREDMAKVMSFKFYYENKSAATVGNWSGTSSNSLAVYIYDDTAGGANWIQPAGVYNLVQSSGVGVCQGTFQTNSTSTAYRIAVIAVNTVGSAFTVNFDDFFVGPQIQLYGAPISDWTSYTPTGSWSTNTTYTGQYRRIGDSAEFNIKVAVSGAPTSAPLTVNLPSGLSIDTTKLASTTSTFAVLGYANIKSAGAAYTGVVTYNSTTSVALLAIRDNSVNTSNKNANVDQADPNTFASGDEVDFIFIAPISGWSSAVQMSNDTDTRVVAARYSTSSASVFGTAGTVSFGTKSFDTHSAYSTPTWTTPTSGYYRFHVSLCFASMAYTANENIVLNFRKNSSLTGAPEKRWTAQASTTHLQDVEFADVMLLNAGDTVDVYLTPGTANNPTLDGTAGRNFLSIERLSGPSTIAASETVFARYYQSSGQTITHNATQAIVNYDTKETDTHGAVTTGASWKFTAPISGTYCLEASNSLSSSTCSQLIHYVYKNGSIYAEIGGLSATGGLISSGQVTGSTSFKLLAGDYVDVRLYQYDNGAVNKNTGGSQSSNHISITRIGN